MSEPVTPSTDRPSRPLPEAPPEAWEPLLRLARLARRPLDRFLAIEAASGILLLASAAVALLLANSQFADAYRALWHSPVGVRVGSFAFERSLEWVVNDGLMVIFFFVVGMEIRREIHHGELSEWRRAVLPAAAAVGGMVAPALSYTLLAGGPETGHGWGVPTATDIAFALGVLALLGNRVPPALRVLLLALAVIDDLGAIVVIAIFYSSGVAIAGLGVALLGILAIALMQRFGVRSKLLYVAPGLVVWGGTYAAGVHPTIAGVVVGLITPVRAWLGPDGFVEGLRDRLDRFERTLRGQPSAHELSSALREFELARREAVAPSEALIEKLHPFVAYGIMPLFALANAGVTLGSLELDATATRVVFGAGVGLVVGKPIGVLAAIGLTVRLGLGKLPIGIGMRQLVVLGLVAGIGFTMALFVAQLAFTNPAHLDAAKFGVFGGSLVAAVIGLAAGRVLLPERVEPGAAVSADEAEDSTEK